MSSSASASTATDGEVPLSKKEKPSTEPTTIPSLPRLPMSSTSFSSAITDGQEPPSKKEKPGTEPPSNLPLPDDLVVSCLAHVSRLHYPIISSVSKTFRSLIASPELHQTRILLDRTEACLYVCLQFPDEPNPRWFTLYHNPTHILTKKKKNKEKEKSSGNVLVQIRITNSPTSEWSNLIAVGPYLYAISFEDTTSSNISFLDCRTHTWLEAPRMRLPLTHKKLDGNMYLPGSSENPESLNSIEVFNTKTQTWKPVPPGKQVLSDKMEGKIYMNFDGISVGKRGVAYNLRENSREFVGLDTEVSLCMIQNITYCYDSRRELGWFADDWRKLKGLEGLPKFARYSNVKLADYGGKMVVLWDKYVPARGGYKEKMVWCAVISLEMRNSEDIWGKVEWFDAVLTVPKSYKFLYAITATL